MKNYTLNPNNYYIFVFIGYIGKAVTPETKIMSSLSLIIFRVNDLSINTLCLINQIISFHLYSDLKNHNGGIKNRNITLYVYQKFYGLIFFFRITYKNCKQHTAQVNILECLSRGMYIEMKFQDDLISSFVVVVVVRIY